MKKITFLFLVVSVTNLFGLVVLLIPIIAGLALIGCGGGPSTPLKSTHLSLGDLIGTKAVIKDVTPRDNIGAGTSDISLAQFLLASDQPEVNWSALTIEQIGSASDTDINAVKIILDNGDGVLNPVTDQVIGKDIFRSGIARIKINNLAVKETPGLYFVTVDLNRNAGSGRTIAVKMSESSFEVTDPIGVFSADLPFSTGEAVVSPLAVVPPPAPIIPVPVKEIASFPLPVKPAPVIPEVIPKVPPIPIIPDKTPAVSEPERPEFPETLDSPAGVLGKLEQEKSIKMQQKEFISQKYYETALELFNQAQYRQSLENLEKALELNPGHLKAQELFRRTQYLLGDRAAEIKTVKEFLENQLQVKIQATEKEATNHFLKGERYFSDGDFQKAIYEFEAVDEKLKSIPYEIGLSEYRKKAGERIKESRDRMVKKEAELIEQQRRAAEALTQQEEEKRQQELKEKIKHLFGEAVLNFKQTNYQMAEKLADKILELVPAFRPAQELKEDSIRVRHKKVYQDYMALKIENWKQILDDMEESMIPYAETQLIRYDKDDWLKASRREPPGLVKTEVTEDPDLLEIKRKLESIKHPFELDGSNTLYEVVDLLQQTYKISILFDGEVSGAGTPNDKKPLNIKGLPLNLGLQHLLNQYNLTYVLKNKSVWIVQSAGSTEELQVKVYNVDDIVRPAPDFAGPSLLLPTTSGPAWAPPPVEIIARPAPEIEKLIEMIKDNASPKSWEREGAGASRMGESNRLVVINTAAVQRQVAEFLQTMRSFSGSMIAIDNLFLAVTDDFMEDIGVELRDLPGNFEVIPGIPIAAGNPAGFAPNPNMPRDLRFRSAYSFLDAQGFSQFAPGGRQVDAGGLGLQYTLLGNTQLNILLRALQKQEKATVLDAPKLVVFNAQRAHVAYLRQQTYIQDLEVVSGSLAYDPVLGTFQTGVVLDVKPVMSYDRKYVTLHIFPTLATLIDLQNFSITAGRGVSDNALSLQLPWIQLQRVRTSTIVPDKGTLLLGGLKKIQDVDITLSTPVLQKIPLIGFLFRRRAKTLEKQNLMIMLRTEILELSELEKEAE
ncbi:MAG: hypothetical protein AAB019_06375 [Planctomycetota bacterium]